MKRNLTAYGALKAQFVLLAGFTSKNRKTEKNLAYFVSQSDSQSIFNHASVLGAKTLLMRSFRVLWQAIPDKSVSSFI